MGMWDGFKGWVWRPGRAKARPEPMAFKEGTFAHAIASQFPAYQPHSQPWNSVDLTRRAYQRNAYAYTAVRMLAQAGAQVPFRVTRPSKMHGGKRQEVPSHRALRLFATPNEVYGQDLLMQGIYTFFSLGGNTFVEMVAANPNRPPVELWTTQPQRVQISNGNKSEFITGYWLQTGGDRRFLNPDEVLHWRTFDPLNDWYGMPPLLATAMAVDGINAAQQWHAATLQNSARPSGLLIAKAGASGLGGGVIDALKEEIRAWMGARNVSKPAVLGVPQGADVSWQQASLDAVELSFLGGIGLNARQVGIALGVPPVLLGDTEGSTYNNYEEARRSLWQDSVDPMVRGFLAQANARLMPRFGDGELLEPVYDAIPAMQDNQGERSKWVTMAFKSGVITQNESREAMGFDEQPGGERYAYEIPGLLKPSAAGGDNQAPEDGQAPPPPPPPGRAKDACEGHPSPKGPSLRLVG